MSELPARKKLQSKMALENKDSEETPDLSHAWETFGMNTQAGKLLRQLYGTQQKVKIDYPEIKTKPRTPSKNAFVTGGGKPDIDPREHKLLDIEVEVPKFYPKNANEYYPIDYVERKKQLTSIKSELTGIQTYLDTFKPNPGKEVSTSLEKEKLQMQFEFKGGKSLPDSVSYPTYSGKSRYYHSGDIPLSTNGQLYLKKARTKAAMKKKADKLSKLEYEELFSQIMEEIEERQKYIAEMDRLGQLGKVYVNISKEIDDRLKELEILEGLLNETEE